MANCEEEQCDNVPSAICLHCQLQLCIPHIVEHGTSILKEGDRLSEEINRLTERLGGSTKILDRIWQESVEKLNRWKENQFETIEKEYAKQFQIIQLKKDQLIDLEKQLSQQLIEQAIQPLDHMQKRKNANMDTYKNIQQAIEDITRQSTQLENDLSSLDINTKTSSKQVSGNLFC